MAHYKKVESNIYKAEENNSHKAKIGIDGKSYSFNHTNIEACREFLSHIKSGLSQDSFDSSRFESAPKRKRKDNSSKRIEEGIRLRAKDNRYEVRVGHDGYRFRESFKLLKEARKFKQDVHDGLIDKTRGKLRGSNQELYKEVQNLHTFVRLIYDHEKDKQRIEVKISGVWKSYGIPDKKLKASQAWIQSVIAKKVHKERMNANSTN